MTTNAPTNKYITPTISKISLKKVRNIKGKKAKLTFSKIKVSYNEYVSSGVRYEVMYAKNKKFTKGKKIKKFAGTLNDKTKTLAKLKKKTYWVKYRVRIKYWNTKYSRMMYKYSGWSKAKKVKIRK